MDATIRTPAEGRTIAVVPPGGSPGQGAVPVEQNPDPEPQTSIQSCRFSDIPGFQLPISRSPLARYCESARRLRPQG